MENFKKGEIVEILSIGSSLSRKCSTTTTLARKNKIPTHLVSDWGDDVKKENITMPIKAKVIDSSTSDDKPYYLLKIYNSKLYIVMAEKSNLCEDICLKHSTEKTNQVKNIKHIINGTTTIVILPDRTKGIAKCHPEDEFDEYIGFCMAYGRALFGQKTSFDTNYLSDYTNEELINELKNRLENK